MMSTNGDDYDTEDYGWGVGISSGQTHGNGYGHGLKFGGLAGAGSGDGYGFFDGDGYGNGSPQGFGDGDGGKEVEETAEAVCLIAYLTDMSFFTCQLHTLGGWR
jgi:hypothetical protein